MKCEKRQAIINLCEKYDFYHDGIVTLLNKYEEDGKMEQVHSKDWGFAIICKYEPDRLTPTASNIMLQFIFIKPEYRRQGHLTNFMNEIKEITGVVSFCASPNNRAMISAGEKLGFKYVCECMSGTEDYYRFLKSTI
jgi:GNAT superfamily N-acetyltransferase|tara:strand:+ start:48 stop:458 length:411 start_codon:yes stop_codon:yes gene_type:complete